MNRKTALVSVCACSAFITAMRIIEMLFLIDSATGFYKSGCSWFAVVSGGLSLLVIASLAYFCGIKSYVRKKLPRPGIFTSVISFATCVSLISVFVSAMFDNIKASNFSALSLVSSLVSIIAVVFFAVYGLSGFIPFDIPAYMPLFLVPVWVYRLVYCFMTIGTMAHIADNVYTIIMLCLCTVFFLFASKALSGISVKNNLSVAVPIGLAASVLCFACTVPRFLLTVFGKGEVLHENSNVDLFIFFVGIFITAFNLRAIKNIRRKTAEEIDSPATDTVDTNEAEN